MISDGEMVNAKALTHLLQFHGSKHYPEKEWSA